MNLFPSVPPSTNELDLRNERISTRLFIILLILSIAILVGYTSLVNVTKTNNINKPTLTEYLHLYSKYSQTLTCPCTNVTIEYEKFLRINYTSHRVGSSTFVTDDWIAYLIEADSNGLFAIEDFQAVGSSIFQTLKALCQSTNRTISDSLSRFYLNKYATLNVISEQLFQLQSQIVMEQFISSTLNDFLFPLQIIGDTTKANNLFTAVGLQHVLFKDPETQAIVSYHRNFDDCYCLSAKCIVQTGFYERLNETDLFKVPGVYVGCFVFEAVLQSTLECFYNQSCINILQSYLISSTKMYNVSSLDSSLSSRYNETSTIQELVNHLMVEKWNLSSTYESYYKECQPIKCTYTYVTKNDALYIVTTILSLIGGLVTVLKFVIPQLVKFTPQLIKIIRRYLRFSRLETANNINQPTVGKWQRIKNYLRELNLLPSVPPSTNDFDLRNERISTRILIISLILTMTILVTYTSLENVTKTFTTNAPNLTQYSDLYSRHSQILTCPCTNISIKYKRFLQVQYTLHQVCNSTFVTKSYIESVLTAYSDTTKNFSNFLNRYPYTLNAVASFCQLMETMLSDSLTRFYSNNYISATVTPEQLFQVQAESSFQQFVFSRINELLLSMQIIRDTNQANAFFSGLFTNYYFKLVTKPTLPGFELLQPIPAELANCSCTNSVSCTEQAVIYGDNSTFVVPGLHVGCFVVEALLKSTLECFYNQTCINILHSYLTWFPPMNTTPLDISMSSHFDENVTVQELLNQLMVEDWNLSIIYKNYYEDCQPSQCSYSYVTKNDAIYIATTIVGLIGGLMLVMTCIIPILVRLIARLIQRRRIAPEMSLVQT